MNDHAGGAVLLVLGDHADERCGVGTSEAALAALAPCEVRVLDPVVGSFLTFRRVLSAARRGARGAVVVYPTISQVERLRVVPRLLLLRLVLRRGAWLRVHLHEFDKLRRRHRVAVALLVGAIADRVVVSSRREADALHTRYRGWAGRSEVAIVPPVNGSAPADVPKGSGVPGRVGVLGQRRPDKGEAWLLDVLDRLDPRFGELEIIGRDWHPQQWPTTVLDRYRIVAHGQLPLADLPARLSSWELAIAPFEVPGHDGRLSLRTPLAHGVPTLTPGPRPTDLQLDPPHLLFDDEVDVQRLPAFDAPGRAAGAAAVARLELAWRDQLVRELFGA